MAKYRLKANYGYVGTETNLGEVDDMTEDEAEDAAWQAAVERVDSWVEEIKDEEGS